MTKQELVELLDDFDDEDLIVVEDRLNWVQILDIRKEKRIIKLILDK